MRQTKIEAHQAAGPILAAAVAALLLGLRLAAPAAGGEDALDHAQNRFYTPMSFRSIGVFTDADADLDIDDPADRDFIRTVVEDRVIQFANSFARTLDVQKLKGSLKNLIDPSFVEAVPSTFWNALTGLPQLPVDGNWSPEAAADLKKIRSAFMLVSLMEFGAPGKFALFEDPEGERGGVEEFAEVQGADAELVRAIKEYEDAWQRFRVVRVLNFTPGPDPAVAGLAAATGLVSGFPNSPSPATLGSWWQAMIDGPLKPPGSVWELNGQWWDLNPGAGPVRREIQALPPTGSTPPLVSGAQLLSTEVTRVRPDTLGADDLLERLATADNWKLKAKYQCYPIDVNPNGGTWSQSGNSLVYAPPPGIAKSDVPTPNRIVESLSLENDPVDLFVFDRSYEVAYGETYPGGVPPMVDARSFLRYLDRLLAAREKPALDLPPTEADFATPPSASSPTVSGTSYGSAGFGTSM